AAARAAAVSTARQTVLAATDGMDDLHLVAVGQQGRSVLATGDDIAIDLDRQPPPSQLQTQQQISHRHPFREFVACAVQLNLHSARHHCQGGTHSSLIKPTHQNHSSRCQRRRLQPASNRQNHPARKAVPPMGGMMPSLPIPVSGSRYRLPENNNPPTTNSAPAIDSRRLGACSASNATPISANAWISW